ncbi:extensin-like [Hevea brasiliensis]|uniref:extensin-like n=1 Tax=Hevea brasiliensis TaxID=3981 RepID=UPI0025EFA1DF|nr:extensin-like [Hevea brasiliensis]
MQKRSYPPNPPHYSPFSFAKNQNPFMATPGPSYSPFTFSEPSPTYFPSPFLSKPQPPPPRLEPSLSSSNESLPQDPSKGKAPMTSEPPPQHMAIQPTLIHSTIDMETPSLDDDSDESLFSESDSADQLVALTTLLMADPTVPSPSEGSHTGATGTTKPPTKPA